MITDSGPRPPVLLSTIDVDGVHWTAVLYIGSTGREGASLTLVFVRDWIVGGTRWITRAVDRELADVLMNGSVRLIDERLQEELRAARSHVPGRVTPARRTAGRGGPD